MRLWLRLATAWLVVTQATFAPFEPLIRSRFFGGMASVEAATTDSMTLSVSVVQNPPAAITNLTALEGDLLFDPNREGALTLNWTEPESGAGSGIPATSYHVRYQTTPNIEDDADFAAATVYTQTWVPSSPGNNRAEVITGLEPGATYYWAIKAQNMIALQGTWSRGSAGDGINDNNFAIAYDTAPPAPANLTATPGTGQNQLAWNPVNVADLDFYRISVDSVTPYDFADAYTLTVDSVSITYTHSGLTNGTTYYYRVTAVDKGAPTYAGNALESVPSNTVYAVPGLTLPNAPELMSDLSNLTTTQIRWLLTDRASNEDALYVYSPPANRSPNLGPLPGTGLMNAYTESGLTPNTLYQRYGEAANVVGSSFSARVDVYTLANPPVNTRVTAVSTSSVFLAWDSNNNPPNTLYEVQYSKNATFTNPQQAGSARATSFTITDLQSNTNYWVRVRAQNESGYTTVFDAIVSTRTLKMMDTVPPKAPAGVWAEWVNSSGGRKVKLHWRAVSENMDNTPFNDPADEPYKVYRTASVSTTMATLQGAPQVPSITTTAAAEIEMDISAGDRYYYRVRAVDITGNESPDSLMIEAVGDGSKLNVVALADDDQSRLTIPVGIARNLLLKEINGLGDDVLVRAVEMSSEEKGKVVKSVQFEAFRADTGESMKDFLIRPAEGTIMVGYEVQNGQVLQGAPTVRGVPGAPLTDASLASQQLSLFWHNGVEWVKVGGVVDTSNQTVSIRTSRLGRYQIRQAVRVGPATLTRVYPQIFTPNDDGWNDKVIFEFENTALLPLKGEIFDLSGAKVGDMVAGPNPDTSLMWDGKRGGQPVPGGVYVYQIEVGGETVTGTVVVAK
ncbi:MAG TPA: fibronectin type III domain-containing protein [Elusimicrobiota bacterium]|nr:fibronectin type III domain-containing protein [Elusimicrobiota bacterium]